MIKRHEAQVHNAKFVRAANPMLYDDANIFAYIDRTVRPSSKNPSNCLNSTGCVVRKEVSSIAIKKQPTARDPALAVKFKAYSVLVI